MTRAGQSKGIPNVDSERAASALSFHIDMDRAAERNKGTREYADGYRLHPVVGAYQKTFQAARLVGGRLQMLQSYPGRTLEGDGTVPDVAAVPPEMDADDAVYVAQLHASLQNTPSVLDHVIKLIALKNWSDLRGPGERRASLQVKDAYATGEPIEISVDTGNDIQEVWASVQDASTGEQIGQTRIMIDHAGNATHRLTPLKAGVYRLTIEAPGLAHSLTDLFIVLNSSGLQ